MEGQNEVRMEATPVASLQTLEKQFMAQLQHKAAETWNYPGHLPANPIPMLGRDLHAFMEHGIAPSYILQNASFCASS